jgi:hypothetical protein
VNGIVATPVNDSYSAASGGTVYGGITSPLPAWRAGAVVDQWFQISGTVHAGSPADPTDDVLDDFCRSNRRLSFSNIAIAGTELVLAACGGHGDYSGNEVTGIDLSADAPAWALRLARTASVTADVAYYGDGRPSARHLYWSAQYSSTRSRLMLHYSRFVYGTAVSFADSNGFNLATNAWDADNTWSDGNSAMCQDNNGDCWGGYGSTSLKKWTASTDTWATTGTFGNNISGPMVFDASRSQLFSLSWGDGQGGGSGVNAYKYNAAGTTQTAITFNASSAYTQFQADTPANASLVYEPDLDRFLFWDGLTGRLYSVAPNSGTTWDMSIVTATGSTPPAAVYSFGRLAYVPALKGCVAMPAGHRNLYFIRTA